MITENLTKQLFESCLRYNIIYMLLGSKLQTFAIYIRELILFCGIIFNAESKRRML